MMQNDTPDISSVTAKHAVTLLENWMHSPNGGKRDEKTVSDRPQNIEFNIEEANAAREKVKMWSVSYKRESNTRKWQKLEEDTMNRLTTANIRNFEKSETTREAIKIIGKHSDTTQTTPVTQQSYTII